MDDQAMPTTAEPISTVVPSWAPAVLILCLLPLIGSVGYIGGGEDDWYYLDAARCLAQHGMCVPTTHWATRWPLVAPMAGALVLFGESRTTVAIIPFLYAVAATILLCENVQRRFGPQTAKWAAVSLVLTPAFFGPALQPAVDIPELVWVLGALLAGQISLEKRNFKAGAACGAALGLAIVTRATALAFLIPLALAWLMLPRSLRGVAVPVTAALAADLATDAAVYAFFTGNPILGWSLALRHTAIPSAELEPWVDLSKSALLNLDFIQNWHRSMGIKIHWTVDPLLNLLADPRCGLTLFGALLLAFAQRKDLGLRDPKRWLSWVAFAALLHFMILTFVLATDPKPRMFLFEIAVAAAVIGVIFSDLKRYSRAPLAVALIALMACRALLMSFDVIDLSHASEVAERWATSGHDGLAVDDWTKRKFALVPAVASLPSDKVKTDLPVLALTIDTCTNAQMEVKYGRAIREVRFESNEPGFLHGMRSYGVGVGRKPVPTLCIYKPIGR